MSNPFGNQTGGMDASFGAGGAGNAFGAMSSALGGGALAGAGDASSTQSMQQGPDLNVSWDELIKSPDYAKWGELYNALPNQAGNYSDALVDWSKFGINRNVAFSDPAPPSMDEFGNWVGGTPTSTPLSFGRISSTPGSINLDGSPIAQRGAYDRDPTEYMGAYDPRLQLIMQDAKGWNDPVSNWIQDQGWNRAMTLIGNPNYRGRNNDSSTMMFQDPATYYTQYMGDDAAKILHADPEAVRANQESWRSNMTPGAQSSRDDAMFGGGGFLGDLGPLSSIAAMIPGPWQPFAMALNAMNSLDQGNILGAVMSGAGAIGGFGGMDFGGAGGVDPWLGSASDWSGSAMGDYLGGGAGLGGLSQYGGAYPMDMGIPDSGYSPMISDFPTDASGQLQFDDAIGQGEGLNSPDTPWNQADRAYNQAMAENPTLEQAVKYGKIGKTAYGKLKAKSDKEDEVAKYLQDMQDNSNDRQEKRSESARNVKSKRKHISALAGV